MAFTPGRSAGLSSLNDFISKAGRDYARMRNTDMGRGAHHHVSTLSPYIRHRLVTEREVVDAILKHHSLAEAEKFIQEVFWRTYFKGWLEHRPHVWKTYLTKLEAGLALLEKEQSIQTSYQEAVTGRTGIDCFDYWTRELIDTGYLHNHARMWFASIWIFTLKLPWELGADFFLRHLLDGDPASNTLSWRWVGGLHTKGKTYLARPDNIRRFTNGRFDPQGQLAAQAEPLVETEGLWPEQMLPQTASLPSEPFLLLIHEDDCHPESLLPKPVKPHASIGALATSHRSPLTVNESVKNFTRAAVRDALAQSGVDTPLIEDDWAVPLIQACKEAGVKNIVTAHTPTGPTAGALAKALKPLNDAEITVSQIIRPWDQCTWPYANRGFFKVKKKIPKILEDLQQSELQRKLF